MLRASNEECLPLLIGEIQWGSKVDRPIDAIMLRFESVALPVIFLKKYWMSVREKDCFSIFPVHNDPVFSDVEAAWSV